MESSQLITLWNILKESDDFIEYQADHPRDKGLHDQTVALARHIFESREDLTTVQKEKIESAQISHVRETASKLCRFLSRDFQALNEEEEQLIQSAKEIVLNLQHILIPSSEASPLSADFEEYRATCDEKLSDTEEGIREPLVLFDEDELIEDFDVPVLSELEKEKLRSKIKVGKVFIQAESDTVSDTISASFGEVLNQYRLINYDYALSMEKLFEIYAMHAGIDKNEFKSLLIEEPSLRYKKWQKNHFISHIQDYLNAYKGKDTFVNSLKEWVENSDIASISEELLSKIRTYKGKDSYFKELAKLLNEFYRLKELKKGLIDKLRPMSPKEAWQTGVALDIPTKQMRFSSEVLEAKYETSKSELSDKFKDLFFEGFVDFLEKGEVVESLTEFKFPKDKLSALMIEIKNLLKKDFEIPLETKAVEDLEKLEGAEDFSVFCEKFKTEFGNKISEVHIETFLNELRYFYEDLQKPSRFSIISSKCTDLINKYQLKTERLNEKLNARRSEITKDHIEDISNILNEYLKNEEDVKIMIRFITGNAKLNKLDRFDPEKIEIEKMKNEKLSEYNNFIHEITLSIVKLREKLNSESEILSINNELLDIEKQIKELEKYKEHIDKEIWKILKEYENKRDDLDILLNNRETLKEIDEEIKSISKIKNEIGKTILNSRRKLKIKEKLKKPRRINEIKKIIEQENEKYKKRIENAADEETKNLLESLRSSIEQHYRLTIKEIMLNQNALEIKDNPVGREKAAYELVTEFVMKKIETIFHEDIEAYEEKKIEKYQSKVRRTQEMMLQNIDEVKDFLYLSIVYPGSDPIDFRRFLTGPSESVEEIESKKISKKFRATFNEKLNEIAKDLLDNMKNEFAAALESYTKSLSEDDFQKAEETEKLFIHWFVQEVKQHIYQRFIKLPMIYADFTNSLIGLAEKLEEKYGEDLKINFYQVALNIISSTIEKNEELKSAGQVYRMYQGKPIIKAKTNIRERSKIIQIFSYLIFREIQGLPSGDNYFEWHESHTYPAPSVLSESTYEINKAILNQLGIEATEETKDKMLAAARKVLDFSKDKFLEIVKGRDFIRKGTIDTEIFDDMMALLSELLGEGEVELKEAIIISLALNGLVHFYLRTLSETEYTPSYVNKVVDRFSEYQSASGEKAYSRDLQRSLISIMKAKNRTTDKDAFKKMKPYYENTKKNIQKVVGKGMGISHGKVAAPTQEILDTVFAVQVNQALVMTQLLYSS